MGGFVQMKTVYAYVDGKYLSREKVVVKAKREPV